MDKATESLATDRQSDLSLAQLFLPPLVLLSIAAAFALVTSTLAGVASQNLFYRYFYTAAGFTVFLILVWIFVEIARMAVRREKQPIAVMKAEIAHRWPYFALPMLIFPTFLACYTLAKTAIPFLVGYEWDHFWANADQMILLDDGYRWTWPTLTFLTPLIEKFYTLVWGFALFVSGAAATFYLDRRRLGIFFTAMMATWLIGGCFMAYATSAAGPVFAGQFDPMLDKRFAPMRDYLASNLDPAGPVALTQEYLASAVDRRLAVMGGGISAMPSMHLGALAVIVLTWWNWPAIRWPLLVLWTIILVGSVHLGYHYLLDGLVASAIASAAFIGSGRVYDRLADGGLFNRDTGGGS